MNDQYDDYTTGLGEVRDALAERYGQADVWVIPEHGCDPDGDTALMVVVTAGDPLAVPIFCPLCGKEVKP